MYSLTTKHTRVVSTKCTPGFACRAFSDTTLVCFIVNEHTTKCSHYIVDVWWTASPVIRPSWPMGLLPDTQNCGCACAGNATFSPSPQVSDPDICVTHVPWCMKLFFEIGGGGRSRHSRRMRNLQFYVSPCSCLHVYSFTRQKPEGSSQTSVDAKASLTSIILVGE